MLLSTGVFYRILHNKNPASQDCLFLRKLNRPGICRPISGGTPPYRSGPARIKPCITLIFIKYSRLIYTREPNPIKCATGTFSWILRNPIKCATDAFSWILRNPIKCATDAFTGYFVMICQQIPSISTRAANYLANTCSLWE